ncbi:hypothetical protein BS78_10G140300 [Paspalum vaginatum]|nr:hypothetical protein BS78_10G140300 [Paspalum vaginatum]
MILQRISNLSFTDSAAFFPRQIVSMLQLHPSSRPIMLPNPIPHPSPPHPGRLCRMMVPLPQSPPTANRIHGYASTADCCQHQSNFTQASQSQPSKPKTSWFKIKIHL